MLQSTTRQGTDYGAQRDLEGEGVLNDSRNRGPEHRTLSKDPESDVGPRSRSSSRESEFSGSMGSPKGSPVAGKKLTLVMSDPLPGSRSCQLCENNMAS